MKTVLKTAAVATLGMSSALISSASAADMAVKAPMYAKAPIMAAYNWSGFYLGANLGGVIGMGKSNDAIALNPAGAPGAIAPGVTNPVSSTWTANSPSGVIGGAQIGYNWQTADGVLGLEGDIDGSGAKSSFQAPSFLASSVVVASATMAYNNTEKLNWLSTVRGRLGWVDNSSLWYVTGGLAVGGVQSKYAFQVLQPAGATFPTNLATFNPSTTRAGWTLGGGVESTLSWLGADNRWTAKVEYLYVDLGNVNNTFSVANTGTAGSAYTITSSNHIHENLVRVGLNYHLGDGTVRAIPGVTSAACTNCNWTGSYLGLNLGGGIGHDNTADSVALNPPTANNAAVTNPVTAVSGSSAPKGLVGGVQIGYNWQAANWVLGVEGDFDGSTQRDQIDRNIFTASTVVVSPATVATTDQQKISWLSTLRGRVGYAQGANLWYVTGGAAAGQVKSNYVLAAANIAGTAFTGGGTASFNTTRVGWTVGGGLERKLPWAGWSAKAEYLYVDLGTVTNAFAAPITAGGANYNYLSSDHVQDHVVRLGVNYAFGGPVIAKY